MKVITTILDTISGYSPHARPVFIFLYISILISDVLLYAKNLYLPIILNTIRQTEQNK